VSGAILERKEFNKCLKHLEQQNKKYTKITHFVVSEASRISRPDDIAEAFTLEERIKSY
jgi:DNA invertase Pin-like site-specific DNA recombinase